MVDNWCSNLYRDVTTESLLEQYAYSTDTFIRADIGCEIVGRVSKRMMQMGMREIMNDVAARPARRLRARWELGTVPLSERMRKFRESRK